MQKPPACRAFDDLGMSAALMLEPPRRNSSLNRRHQIFAVLGALLVLGNFFGGWRSEAITMNAQSRFLASFDEARQLVHASVLRSTVEHRILDARFARRVLSHRSEMDAPIGGKTRIAHLFGHLTPSLIVPLGDYPVSSR
jgi:hypothetical protein